MKRLPDGAGRTLFIAGLAGSIFAAFLVITPKLTTSGVDTVGESIGGVPAATVTPSVTTATAATTTTPLAVTTTTTPPPTTTLPATTTTTMAGEPMTPGFGYDGTVRLSVTATGPPGNEWPAIRDGDQISWTFHVTNTTDQELWGVFVWLELVGRAQCEAHHLWPMGDTDCRVTSTAQAGEQTAEVWVDAWTTSRQVRDKVFFQYRVLAI
ncbi:MAG: hypothetical protein V1757_07095 [Actinomycetota bacterium]